MWYKFAKKYNMFGLPISGDLKFNLFADEDADETAEAERIAAGSSNQKNNTFELCRK